MIVSDLLKVADLRLRLAWGPPELLERQVTGVTSTDLQDPARYLQPGELVLSGLVWWQPGHPAAQALRFATSLRSAGVAALLAGEGTHGEVPDGLVEACRVHGIPLLSVPAGTSFRAVTDRVYLRLWGDLRAQSAGAAAVPDGARRELVELMYAGAPAAEVLDGAVSRLGCGPCSLVTAAGRTIASSAGAPDPDPETVRLALPVPPGAVGAAGEGGGAALTIGEGGDSPFDGWYLYPHAAGPGQAAVLHGLADVLATLWTRSRGEAAERRRAAGRLAGLLTGAAPVHPAELGEALASCGLPAELPLIPLAARIDGLDAPWAADALAEALRCALAAGAAFAVGADERGRVVAVVADQDPVRLAAGLREVWPRLQSRLPDRHLLRVGVGPRAARPAAELAAGLRQARYALDAAAADRPRGCSVGASAELDSLAALVRGIPAEVADAFRRRLLDPLTEHDRHTGGALLATLVTFLDHDCSWARSAEALHVHVNTVHYRVRRIEELTDRDLGRLDDRLDLRAALLCGPPRER
ncbi:PucR family transcriptional regulator [Kitasatospora sp. NBC_01287]|uniref:PucR family transcriptional regulator n=1 Tax=Kitasatospora sp. NBC_01287 TaxID=2903573 RepID=UPI0022505BF0|nr:PucR family transcriptional regulator [Kitasatospora sp. NBC_01287]MCX4747177.1 PucR family transcriptional regulator [Kitasatospora sp. NBC_01287]